MRPPRGPPWLPLEISDRKHRGKWVVLIDDAIVDSDRDLCACLTRVRSKHPGSEPVVLKFALPSGAKGERPRVR
jgi:hypothetical protein